MPNVSTQLPSINILLTDNHYHCYNDMMKWSGILFIFIQVAQAANQCENYKVKYTHNKKSIVQRKLICKDKDVLFFPQCKKKDCYKKHIPTTSMNFKNFVSKTGSPGHLFCHYLDGIPKAVKLKKNNKWKNHDFCNFNGFHVSINAIDKGIREIY